jgi:hypothetical protein
MDYKARRETWERCWAQHSVPPYFTSTLELQLFRRLRGELFDKYLHSVAEISEFGCGTGHNLAPLLGSGVRLRGFDWSQSAVGRCRRLGIEAEVFDMLRPNREVKLSGAVLTVHALEQLGADWGPFLDFLVANKPLLCLHIEPIEELYDEHDPHDAACLEYHRSRGYLTGYLTRLREMEALGAARLIEVRKSPFGGTNHDAYSVIVWRPN